MKITKDTDTGSMYIKIRDRKISAQKTVGENIVLDQDADGKIVGIEIIDKNAFFSNTGFFKWFTRRKMETHIVNRGDLRIKKG